MLDLQNLLESLEATGQQLNVDHDVEILVVGGAAGMLTGELSESWTTGDVDVLHCHLPVDRDAVLDAAAAVARSMNLPLAWMNDICGLHAWALPSGWERRRVLIGKFHRLSVYAVGRQDLIAMKFIAHRARDLEHLEHLRPSAGDREFVERHLDVMLQKYPEHVATIDMAREIVRNFEQNA